MTNPTQAADIAQLKNESADSFATLLALETLVMSLIVSCASESRPDPRQFMAKVLNRAIADLHGKAAKMPGPVADLQFSRAISVIEANAKAFGVEPAALLAGA